MDATDKAFFIHYTKVIKGLSENPEHQVRKAGSAGAVDRDRRLTYTCTLCALNINALRTLELPWFFRYI